MARVDADRNLLIVHLAHRLGLIDREALEETLVAVVARPSRDLESTLVATGGLEPADLAALGALADRQIAKHGDAARGLDSLDSATTIREVRRPADPDDLRSTLADLSDATTTHASGNGAAANGDRHHASSGRFRILRLHDRGGLGEVFVAHDGEVRREVAFKQMRPEHADDLGRRARFLLEAQITGGLEHPGIVPVYGLGHHDDGRPYYAMRFIRGDSLKEAINRFHAGGADAQSDPGRRSLELRKLLRRFLDVCDAIAYAHSRGVLHRDLKPGNVMLGPYGETLVVDWGLAQPAHARGLPQVEDGSMLVAEASGDVQATEAGSRIGTPAYMPPEQAAGRLKELGPASDVYSLGATLYALLTGKAPFGGSHIPRLLEQVERGEFPPPRQHAPKLDRALEAICLKAMALRPADRYPTPRALGDDLQSWLADEPVAVWREPLLKRLARWSRRHRTLVTASAAAAVVGLTACSYLLYESGLRDRQRRTAAHGRVDALRTAEVLALPLIRDQLGGDRALVRDRLETLARGDGTGRDDRDRLAGALALLPDDPEHSAFLLARALKPEATPEEILVIREALHAEADRGKLASAMLAELRGEPTELTDRQLRAAGLLAKLAPADAAWVRQAGPLSRKLVRENPLRIGPWREVFQPVAPALAPALRVAFADRSQPEGRERAFTLLFDFAARPDNADRAEDLAALLAEAAPEQAREVIALLNAPADRERAIRALTPQLLPVARLDAPRAARQGRVAAALVLLGRPEPAWPLLRQSDDPSTRTEVIHGLARSGVDPAVVVARLRAETDLSARRSLVLALGEFPPAAIAEAQRATLSTLLLGWYRDDPDPGIHGAVDWLLRQRWGRGADLEAINLALRTADAPADRRWYVNRQGQTYAVVRGPVEFRMGSTVETDPERVPNESAHRRRIDRSFAIDTREVTFEEYARFLDAKLPGVEDLRADAQLKHFIDEPGSVVGSMIWYEAARYCNWLSQQEGIPEAQWCYPREVGPGMTLPADFLARTGYRLPTEAEWEYACRAGTISARPFGQIEHWLSEYGWFSGNGSAGMHPPGRKKPNDLGLFDALGNAIEFCNDPMAAYPATPDGRPAADNLAVGDFSDKVTRLIRGGTFFFPANLIRSAWRVGEQPTSRDTVVGFRPARTVP